MCGLGMVRMLVACTAFVEPIPTKNERHFDAFFHPYTVRFFGHPFGARPGEPATGRAGAGEQHNRLPEQSAGVLCDLN